MNQQTRARLAGERRAQRTLLQLLCLVSLWRTAMTRVLPLCGAAAWWTTLLCLLPGIAVTALLRLTMALTGAPTLAEAMRACLGKAGTLILASIMSVLLLLEGTSAITALITLFTQGVGTRGTQLTLAVLTGSILLFSLHREGLARAAHLLRWLIAAAGVLLAVSLMTEARLDHLFPLWGEGENAVYAALRAGISLAWPFVLLLTIGPARGEGRLMGGFWPAVLAVGGVLVAGWTLPHELLVRERSLAALLLLPTRYAANSLRLLSLCLIMLTFFLAVGASVQLATESLCMPWKNAPKWLPRVLLAGLVLTQALDVQGLWRLLGKAEPWLLAPLALLAAVCLPIAVYRRNLR